METTNRNYFAECYLATTRKDINSWEDMENDSGGLVGALTYITLFLNDQIAGYMFELNDMMKQSQHNRHAVKKILNDMNREIKRYNTVINGTTKDIAEYYADVMARIEEDLKPALETYRFSVSRNLLKHGVAGEINSIASYAAVINMLCQTSRITIDEFYLKFKGRYRITCNPLSYLKMDRLEKLSDSLGNAVTPKTIHLNLNEANDVNMAFEAFSNKLLYGNTLNKIIGEK